MPNDLLIPFDQVATLNNPVFQAAGIAPKPAAPAAPEVISFDQIESAPAEAIDPSQISHIDDFHRRTAEDLHKDDKFDPRAYFADNPDVAKDPAQLQKLIDVYRARRERGVTLGALGEGVKAAPGTAVKFAKGLGTLANNVFEFSGLQPLFNKAASVVTGDAFDKQRSEALEKESEDRARKAYSEFQAGTELSATGLSDLARTGARKIFGKSVKDTTDQELLAQLSEDAAFQNQLREIQQGRGETLKNAGLDADTLAKDGIQLDSQAIENLSLVDPATVVATAGLFKVVGAGGKILATAGTEIGANRAAAALNNLATQTAGKAVQATGKVVTAGGEAAAKAAGAVPEAVTEATGAGVGLAKSGTVSGAYVGAKAARGIQAGIVKGGQAAARVGEGITNIGENISTRAEREAIEAAMRDAAAKGIPYTGPQIPTITPLSPGTQKLANFVSTAGKYARPVTGAVKGAAIGTAAAAPIALLADEDQTAGGILSGGIALGGVAGGTHGTFGAVTDAASNRYFGAHEKLLPDVASPGYGIEPALDTAHEAKMQTLPVRERNLINNFREGTRNIGGEFYTLNEAQYRDQVAAAYKRETGKDITPALLQKYADTHAQFSEYRPDPNGNVRKVVLLNGDAVGLLHDAGHLFDASLAPDVADSLRKAVAETFTPEQLADARARYERRLGTKITPERAMDEFIAEQFNALFHNVPLNEMTAPPSLLGKFTDAIAKGAEALGVDLARGKATPSLQNPLSVGLRELFKNAAQEILKANESAAPTTPPAGPAGPAAGPTAPVSPAPTAPGAPTPAPVVTPPGPAPAAPAGTPPVPPPNVPTPAAAAPAARNIRVTQAQQDAFAKRAAEIGVTEAKANAAGEPEVAARVKEISDSMEAGNPVLEIEHLGIKNEGSPAAPSGRGVRRGEQAKGYADLEAIRADNRANAPESIVNRHQKTFVPGRWTNQGGTPTLIAFSLDKIIQNIHKIVADAADKNSSKRIPYASENGKLTEEGWNKAIADAQAYAENQSNGFRGDGQRLVRPTEDLGFSIPAENPDYKPQLLGEAEANFQNLIQGLATPETPREQKGLVPGNIKGQVLAEANKRALLTPADLKPAAQKEFKSFPGRTLKEVNPLRNELAQAGVNVRDLIEVTERIRAKDIASVKPRPDINFKAPVTDIIRGGFLPKEGQSVADFGADIIKDSPEDWIKRTRGFSGGSLTGDAYRLGLGLTDPADVQVLRDLSQQAAKQAADFRAAKDLDGTFAAATKQQYFNEALETATGSSPTKQQIIGRVLGDPNWQPPFPQEALSRATGKPSPQNEEGGAFFLPKTKAGQKLADEGFDFRISGQQGIRAVTVLKDGIAAGEFQSRQRTADVAEISNVQLKPQFRGTGAAEAAYRELLTQLKEDGVKKVEGTVVAPEPLALRRKIFGGFDRLELNGKPVSIQEALQAADQIKKTGGFDYETGVINVEAVNEITPESQFLPKTVKETLDELPEGNDYLFGSMKKTPKVIGELKALSPGYFQDLADSKLSSAQSRIWLAKNGGEQALADAIKQLEQQNYLGLAKGRAPGADIARTLVALWRQDAHPEDFGAGRKSPVDDIAPGEGAIRVPEPVAGPFGLFEKQAPQKNTPEVPKLSLTGTGFETHAEMAEALLSGDLQVPENPLFRPEDSVSKIVESRPDLTPKDRRELTNAVESHKSDLITVAEILDGKRVEFSDYGLPTDTGKNAPELLEHSLGNFAEQLYQRGEFPTRGLAYDWVRDSAQNVLAAKNVLRWASGFYRDLSVPEKIQKTLKKFVQASADRVNRSLFLPKGESEFLPSKSRTEKKAQTDHIVNVNQLLEDARQSKDYRADQEFAREIDRVQRMFDKALKNQIPADELRNLHYLETQLGIDSDEHPGWEPIFNAIGDLADLLQDRAQVSFFERPASGIGLIGSKPLGPEDARIFRRALLTRFGLDWTDASYVADRVFRDLGIDSGFKHTANRVENQEIADKALSAFRKLSPGPAEIRMFISGKTLGELAPKRSEQLPRAGEDLQFLPKKKGEEKKVEFPAYVVPAPQNRGLEKQVDAKGVTEQFWVNSKTGKVILAPDGHEEAANATVLRDEPAIRESGDTAEVYDAMHARGWVRGVLEPEFTSQPGILLNSVPGVVLGPSARRTLEDIAFKSNRPVFFNDRQTDIGPIQPGEGGAEPLFLPKKVKRDEEGRPLKGGLIDYERLYKEKAAAERKQQREEEGKPTKTYESAPAAATGTKGITGWLLPNKEFVPLDTAFHEQYLAQNADKLNERFGTQFASEPNVDARLDALNAGFTRLRYEAENGALHIETAAKNWAASRKQILNRIEKAADSVDRLIVSLLDEQGKVVDSINEKLFNLEGPERLNKIEEAIDSLRARGSRYLPKQRLNLEGTTPPAAAPEPENNPNILAAKNIARVKRDHPEALVPVYAKDENGNVRKNWEGMPLPVTVEYNLPETPLAKQAAKGLKGDARTKAIAVALGDKLVKEYEAAVKNPEIEAGSTWYSTARERLRKLLGDDAKFFAELLGATSPQTSVDTNFKYSVEAYNQFKSGAYDQMLEKYREGKKAWADAQIDDFLRDTKIEDPTRGQFLDWWVKKNNLIPLQSNGKRFGLHSRAVLRVLDRSWLSEVKGPKTPNFTGNLTGETFEATIDVWAARAMHRLANEGNTKRWRIMQGNETGVSDADFYLGQAAFRHAAEKLGIQPDALQAVLWFAEKDKWEKNGWTKAVGAKKSDFNSLLGETERSPEGKLTKKKIQLEL